MNTSNFCFGEQTYAIHHVQCMDGKNHVLVVDLFNAAQNSNKNRHMKRFEQGVIRTIAEHVCPRKLEANKKQFNNNICKSKLIDETQAMTVLKHMESTCLIESLKLFLSVLFVDSIQVPAEEGHEEEKTTVGFENFDLDSENSVLRTQFGNIQYAYDSDKEPVFRALDVTRALGYENSDQAIRAHVDVKYCVSVAYESKKRACGNGCGCRGQSGVH